MSRPEEGTPEYDLYLAAIAVAVDAPLKRGAQVHAAQIPWSSIERVRTALDALGIDWQSVKAVES